MTTITTQHGTASVYYDTDSDPANPGYVLRYSNGVQDLLDEALDAETEDEAMTEALRFLADEGIEVGE